MKNRTYRAHNRAIKEVRPGVWQGRISGIKGYTDIPPFEIRDRDAAFRWLRDGPHRLLPPCPLSAILRAQILERQKLDCQKIQRRAARLRRRAEKRAKEIAKVSPLQGKGASN